MEFCNFAVSLIAIYLRQNPHSLSNNKCFDDYSNTASLFLPSCTLTPLLALRRLPRATNATDLLSQPILPTYVTHRPANTLSARFSTP